MKLNVVSYNIKHGVLADHDFSLIADDILKYDPDLVGLQELDLYTARSPGLDELAMIAQSMGYEHYRFARAIDYKGGQYGCGIISRYPIKEFTVHDMEVFFHQEGRSCSHAVIEIGGKDVNFFNTHANGHPTNGTSQSMFSQINKIIRGKEYGILTGDFNSRYEHGFYPLLEGYDAADKGESIDNICFTKEFKLLSYGKAPKKNSDHALMFAVLEFDGEI